MKLLIILAILVAAEAKASQRCTVSDWSPWHTQPSPDVKPLGLSGPSVGKTGQGEKNRHKIMELMEEHQQYYKSMYDNRPSEGRVDCVDGNVNELNCSMVDQMSLVNITDMGFNPDIDISPRGNDIWGWTDTLTSREYAIFCMSGSTNFVDVTDPENPTVLGYLDSHLPNAEKWRDVKVYNNHAYIVSEVNGHGMQVFDLTQLRDVSTPQIFNETGHHDQVGNCHNIVINEDSGFIYLVGCTDMNNYPNACSGGLYILDANADPANPTYAGCYDGDGYVHDAQCVNYIGPDTRYSGKEICFCYNEEDFTIVDVTDKLSMTMISRVNYNNFQYTHQGWLSEDQSVAYMDDELDEYNRAVNRTRTLVWNMRDLTLPVLMNEHMHEMLTIDHNQYVKGNYIYQSNNMAGLRIMEILPDYQLAEVGFFDTFPGINLANFAGMWSVYPYFPSGNIICSTREFGLFTVRPRMTEIKKLSQKKTGIQTRYRVVLDAIDDRYCPVLHETKDI